MYISALGLALGVGLVEAGDAGCDRGRVKSLRGGDCAAIQTGKVEGVSGTAVAALPPGIRKGSAPPGEA